VLFAKSFWGKGTEQGNTARRCPELKLRAKEGQSAGKPDWERGSPCFFLQ
jgi:hypothetical protein